MSNLNGGLGKLAQGYTARRVSPTTFWHFLDTYPHNTMRNPTPTLTTWYDLSTDPARVIAACTTKTRHDQFYLISWTPV